MKASLNQFNAKINFFLHRSIFEIAGTSLYLNCNEAYRDILW
ncbi:hypothetical protein CKC_01710 [Candidatus Liberibacter solanacearum CLso-ZC1]|uniref:Uncharacterized protein n=1 Tax=Liberibacter solanacearum (strain CLso-ZC1) TaxID=658172 RepID=E4UCK3_LIBSC|nr:hypothetical protein CKC_01710 [Candidatus Liberibacter solanacearum CLso-ZC1]